MNRIIVLSELYYPSQESTGRIITQIAEGLAQTFSIKVVTNLVARSLMQESVLQHEIKQSIEIWRCKVTSFDKNWLPGRLINGLSSSISIFFKALFLVEEEDCILVVTNPPFLPFIALLLKLLKRCHLVLLVHDVYPEALIVSGLTDEFSTLSKLLRLVNSNLYQNADRIVSLGRDMTKLLETRGLNNASSKIVCIPNWAECSQIYPMKKSDNSIVKKLGLEDKFTVLYAGTMGRTHDIEIIGKVAATFEDLDHRVYFLFIGTGLKQLQLEHFIASNNLQNAYVMPYLPSSEKNISHNACDVAIISFLPGMVGVSVPSRMYNIMAAGKPIIAVADLESELAEVIREENIGWVVQPRDVQGLTTTILDAVSNPVKCSEMGSNAAVVARSKYTFDKINSAYHQLFSELFKTS
jgi:glycosyltransferase involved in cell wall biosynthesis